MCKLLNKHIIRVLLLALWLLPNDIFSQTIKPTITFYSVEDETNVEMSEGESQTAQAPLTLLCNANISEADLFNYTCEWRFFDSREGEDKPLLTRFEEDTEYELEKSGSYGIKLYVTFTDEKGESIEMESELFTIIYICFKYIWRIHNVSCLLAVNKHLYKCTSVTTYTYF